MMFYWEIKYGQKEKKKNYIFEKIRRCSYLTAMAFKPMVLKLNYYFYKIFFRK